MKLVVGASRLELYEARAETGLHGIRIMLRSGAACLPAVCCFSESALKILTNRVGLVESRHHHLIEK
jgi:hypothetical protein